MIDKYQDIEVENRVCLSCHLVRPKFVVTDESLGEIAFSQYRKCLVCLLKEARKKYFEQVASNARLNSKYSALERQHNLLVQKHKNKNEV